MLSYSKAKKSDQHTLSLAEKAAEDRPPRKVMWYQAILHLCEHEHGDQEVFDPQGG